MDNYILLTGATGFLGQFLLHRLLRADVPIAVVARSSPAQSAKERIAAIVGRCSDEDQRDYPTPVCFTGDLTTPDLGIDEFALDWFREHCNACIHNAASIRFHGKDREREPWRSNIGGTENVLHFCDEVEIANFHHVSTAYVCGDRRDHVMESDLEVGQGYENDYEQSKLEAEELVREAEFLDSLTVHRPAVVIGDSRTGFTSSVDFGLYQYIQFVWQQCGQLRQSPDDRVHFPMRLRLSGDEKRNLVTADWVSDVMVKIVTHPELHNQTYHLTPKTPTPSRDVFEAISDYFRIDGVELVEKGNFNEKPGTEFEKLFYDFADTFEAYWGDEPTFDRSNTAAAAPEIPYPQVDQACIKRMIEFAVNHVFEKQAV